MTTWQRSGDTPKCVLAVVCLRLTVVIEREPDTDRPLWRINPDTEAKQEARELLEKGKGIHNVAKTTGLSEWAVKKLRDQMRTEGLQKLNQRSDERQRGK